MMKLMFGKDVAVDLIKRFTSAGKMKEYNKYAITSKGIRVDKNLYKINIDFPKLKIGNELFTGCEELREFKGALPNLTTAHDMFSYCYMLKKFENDLPSLVDGNSMFERCQFLKSFKGNLSSLKDGTDMFYLCSELTDFEGDLSSLENGDGMFEHCNLNQKSVENILNSVPTYPQNEKRKLTIGNHYSVNTLRLKWLFAKKGWDVEFSD